MHREAIRQIRQHSSALLHFGQALVSRSRQKERRNFAKLSYKAGSWFGSAAQSGECGYTMLSCASRATLEAAVSSSVNQTCMSQPVKRLSFSTKALLAGPFPSSFPLSSLSLKLHTCSFERHPSYLFLSHHQVSYRSKEGARIFTMSHSPMVFSTIHFEELPLHFEYHTHTPLRPTSIEEDEDDPRSLLYLFEDNDFERAAAFLAIEEARQQAQARAEALAEAEAQQRRLLQQQRVQALADQLRQLLEEDDELIDLLGRRLLAVKGHQVPDIWQPHHHRQPQYQHYHYGPHYYPHASYRDYASSSRIPHMSHASALTAPRTFQSRDVHAAWDELMDASSSGNARASPFIHSAPVVVRGHAPRSSQATKGAALGSTAAPEPSRSSASKPSAGHTSIAIHPVTGVPMLLVEQDSSEDADPTVVPSRDVKGNDAEADDEADEWAVDDESDLDWLGRELLRRQGGANVWVLGSENGLAKKPATSSSTSQAPSSCTQPSTSSAETTSVGPAEPPTSTLSPTLPVQVEEVDSDHELASIASALDPAKNESTLNFNSPSHRIAAALAQAALSSPSTAEKSNSYQRHRKWRST